MNQGALNIVKAIGKAIIFDICVVFAIFFTFAVVTTVTDQLEGPIGKGPSGTAIFTCSGLNQSYSCGWYEFTQQTVIIFGITFVTLIAQLYNPFFVPGIWIPVFSLLNYLLIGGASFFFYRRLNR